MANSSAKKLLKSNTARLNNLKIAILAANLFFAVFRLGVFRASFTTFFKVSWGVLTLFYAAPFYLLWATARPTFGPDGKLQSAGDDISRPGLLEYAHDVIYLTILVHVLLSFSRFALLLFLSVPAYLLYSWASAPKDDDGMPDDGADLDDGAGGMSRKERRKAERASRKQK